MVRTVEKIRQQALVEPSVSRFGANQGKDFFNVAGKPFYSLPLATVPVKLKADMASKST